MIRFALALTALVTMGLPAFASGPFLPQLRFFSHSGQEPDNGITYFKGQLGILRPSFTENRLYAAYRILLGQGFTDDQVKQLMTPCCDLPNPSNVDFSQSWLDARATIVKDKVSIGAYRKAGEFDETLNCFPSAFDTAAATLKARIATHGADDPGVKAWITGQDAVFANCNTPTALPADAPADAPAWLKADRAYQTAAAYFYRLNYAEARKRFAAIAADAASPWAVSARYLTARAAVHDAVATKTPNAIARAQQDLAAAGDAGKDRDLAKLSALLAFTTNPERIRDLERQLLAPVLPDDLAIALHDFRLLAADKAVLGTDLGVWIHAMENSVEAPDTTTTADLRPEVIRHWQATPTLPWLIAALAFLRPGDPNVPAAIEQSRKLEPNSPGFYTAAWHRVRLLIGKGEVTPARAELDTLLAAKTLPPGVRNLLLIERLHVAPDVAAFLRDAPRRAELVFPFFDESHPDDTATATLPLKTVPKSYAAYLGWRTELFDDPRYLDTDAAVMLSFQLPLSVVTPIALSDQLPANIRRDVALAAWTRAVLLQDDADARLLGKALADVFPDYAGDWQKYNDATAADERRFAAALLLLRFPAAKPWVEENLGYTNKRDVIGFYGDRWWSKDSGFFSQDLGAQTPDAICRDDCSALPGRLGPATFPSSDDRRKAAEERKKLQALNSAAGYLGPIVIGWAKAHPDDARVPEALHLVVRLTQYGDPRGDISRQAYNLLRAAYPKDSWTKQTPHWFGK